MTEVVKKLPVFYLFRIKIVGLSSVKSAKTGDFTKLGKKGTRKRESFIRKGAIFPLFGTDWNKLGKIQPQGQQGARDLIRKESE